MLRVKVFPFFLLFIFALTGCGSGDVTAPEATGLSSDWVQGSSTHRFWGIYDVYIDPVDGPSVVPLRTLEGHLNARGFLEVAPCANCIVVSNPHNLGGKEWKVDVQIRHPFIGLDKFTGFDVRGIVMFDPTYTFPSSGLDFPDPDIQAGGALINPDGYTDIFNPVDYAPGSQTWPAWEYQQGKYATPVAPVATLNPYKEYGVGNERRYFGCSMADTQTYHLRFPSDGPLHFGYAIDANWAPAYADPPVVPDDFPLTANRPEPYQIEMTVTGNTLWSEEGVGGGGDIRFHLKLYDHQDPRPEGNGGTIESFRWEIPGMTGWNTISPISWTEGNDSIGVYVDFEFIEVPVPDMPGNHKCLIGVTDTEIGLLGLNERAYFLIDIYIHNGETCWSPGEVISDIPNGNYQSHLTNAHCTYVDDMDVFHLFYLDTAWEIHHFAYSGGVLFDEIIVPGEKGYNINAVMDDSGTVHLLYADDPDSQGGNIVYRQIASDGEVSSPTILSASPHYNQFEPALAVAPNGDILALWMDSHTQPKRRLCGAYYNGLAWTPEMTLEQCNLPNGWVNVSVVCDSTNTFHMTYCDDGELNLYYRQFQYGILGPVTALVKGSWRTEGAVMTIGPDDQVYVTYEDTRTGSLRGYLRLRDPLTGEWSEEKDLTGHNYQMNRFQSEYLPWGNLAVIWTDWRDGYRGLYSKVFDPFQSESEIQAIADDEIDAISYELKNQTRLCVDKDGTLHLVWSDFREGHWQLFYSTCTP